MKEPSPAHSEATAYRAFLRNYKEVAKFTVEALTDNSPRREDDYYKSEISRPYTFNENEFYDFLYVEREVEEVLKYDIRNTKDYVCFVGPRGTGKTTVGKKIQRDLQRSEIGKTFIIFLDIRFLKANLNLRKDRFIDSLRWQVMVRYLEELFPLDYDSNVFERLRLWEYLLRPAPRSQLPKELRAGIFDLQSAATTMLQKFRIKKMDSQQTDLFTWLKITHLNKKVSTLTEKLEKRIGIAHLVYAARDLCHYDSQVIWFDNTDALPDSLQPEVVDLVKSFHRSVSQEVSTVVAIREENIFRDEDPFEEPGAPPHRKRVKMRIDRDEGGNPLYGIDIPIISATKLEKIIEKRMDLAKLKQKQYRDEFRAKLETEYGNLEGALDREQRASVEARMAEYTGHLGDYEPLVSENGYAKLKHLSKEVLTMLQENMLIYLTNSSLRDFLFIHRDVLAYILKSARYEIDTAAAYPQWYMSTLFYHWLAITDRDYHIPAYNIITETENWIHGGRQALGCVLPYLIITTIWNLTIEKEYDEKGRKAFQSPTVGEVVGRLGELGYKRDEVIDRLHKLHVDIARGSIVEFRYKGKLLTPRDLNRDDVRVYLTYRGRCLVSLSCNTFGYFYQDMLNHLKRSGAPLPAAPLEMRRASEYAEEMLPYLCDIAQMHYDTFKLLRAGSHLHPRQWLLRYHEYFGAPQKEPYRRNAEVGVQIKGIRRALQFEALLSGLIRYSAGRQISLGTAVKDKMQALQNRFAQCIESLGGEGDPPNVDFRSELRLPSR